MTREEKIAVVESYIHGLGNGDFANVPFADDVSYESPLTPKRLGQEAIAFLSALFPIMQGAEVQQHIVEGEYIATVFRLRTPNGITTVFDKFRVVIRKNFIFNRNWSLPTCQLLPMTCKDYTLRPVSFLSSSNIAFKTSAFTVPMRS